MTVIERLQSDLKAAMKAKDELRLGTIRMALAALKNRQIELRNPTPELALEEKEVLTVLERERKKRREAADLFRQGGRPELAEKEEAEMKVLEAYLPVALSDSELDALISEEIAKGTREFGPLMKAVLARAAGRADGRTAGDKIKAKLAEI